MTLKKTFKEWKVTNRIKLGGLRGRERANTHESEIKSERACERERQRER